MICRWAQEILGYQFTCVHRRARMIVDVDTLTRRFGSSIAMHCKITSIMSSRDILSCPQAHDTTNLSSHTADKLSQPPATVNTQLILSSTLINSLFTGSTLSV